MKLTCGLVLFLFAAVCGSAQTNWKLIWSDEFNARTNTPPDSSKWIYDLGASGWGNNELERYTNSSENIVQDGNGHLVIRAIKTPAGYTSARIKTQGRFEFQYGKLEARIKLPKGQGLWPAFWMLGNDMEAEGWPACGEIDVMESIGKEPSTVHGTIHGPEYFAGQALTSKYVLTGAAPFSDDFHVFGLEWKPGSLIFYVDQQKYAEMTPAVLPASGKWVYDHPFWILLNLAVGGDWPGPPDATTEFPQTMLVDWVRVYQADTAAGAK
ncbi:MAG: glycoside hydrolase family 16 protein [Bryobacteraceae bacterium]